MILCESLVTIDGCGPVSVGQIQVILKLYLLIVNNKSLQSIILLLAVDLRKCHSMMYAAGHRLKLEDIKVR